MQGHRDEENIDEPKNTASEHSQEETIQPKTRENKISNQKTENVEATKTETISNDDIVLMTTTNKEGGKLNMSFNNTKGTATLNFKGEISN